jgi:TPR repeat protein
MRISKHIASLVVTGAALAAAPALAFEGTTPGGGRPAAALSAPTAGLVPPASIPVPPMPIASAAPSGAVAVKNAVPAPNTLTALQYAAEGGHPIAQWRLGRMYADGDGVDRDHLRAFDYFSRIANQHAEDSPSAPQAQIVANAFVALGRYYRDGIPNTRVKSDRERAREMFHYAASYFGNADAQYNLARMYLDGTGSQRDPKYAARWLAQAAQKGQFQAQALLGQMLFNGDVLPRQAARGLMWLTLARDNAGPEEVWINEVYTSALKRASEDDRAMAGRMLERWVQGRRD